MSHMYDHVPKMMIICTFHSIVHGTPTAKKKWWHQANPEQASGVQMGSTNMVAALWRMMAPSIAFQVMWKAEHAERSFF